jgi:hypothetical protein
VVEKGAAEIECVSHYVVFEQWNKHDMWNMGGEIFNVLLNAGKGVGYCFSQEWQLETRV